jgi:hypothetical protein
MTPKDMRERFGGRTIREAIHAAIRADLPGGPETLDAYSLCQRYKANFTTVETIGARDAVWRILTAMEAEIRRRYELPPAN